LAGWKRDAIKWIDVNAAEVFATADALYDAGDAPLLSYLADLPGLGLAKGGFLAQLVWGVVGCLDSHNVARFGLNANQFAAYRFKSAKTATTRQKLVRQYLALCEECGGCETLWNDWCAYVADRDIVNYQGADHVSGLHQQFICGQIAA
jgi:hypothetical protein